MNSAEKITEITKLAEKHGCTVRTGAGSTLLQKGTDIVITDTDSEYGTYVIATIRGTKAIDGCEKPMTLVALLSYVDRLKYLPR